MVKKTIRFQVRTGKGNMRTKRDSFKKRSDAKKLMKKLKKQGIGVNPRIRKVIFTEFKRKK